MTLNELLDKCIHSKTEERDGYLVCLKCAQTIDKVFVSKPRRAYNKSEVDSKKHAERVFSKNVSRTLLDDNYDWNKKRLSPETQLLFRRLRKRQSHYWSNDPLERNLLISDSAFRTLKTNFTAPKNVWKGAERIYYHSAKNGLIKGRSIDGFVVASLYASIRCNEYPSSFDDIIDSSPFSVEKKAIARSYKLIVSEEVLTGLGLKLKPAVPPLLKYCFELGLSQVVNEVIDFYKNLPYEIKNGRDPKGVSAAVIYVVSIKTGNRRTQKEISKVVKVTEVTLRSRHKEIKSKA